jgi:septal ring factor EnvC (AmiA/AmiB activator)
MSNRAENEARQQQMQALLGEGAKRRKETAKRREESRKLLAKAHKLLATSQELVKTFKRLQRSLEKSLETFGAERLIAPKSVEN